MRTAPAPAWLVLTTILVFQSGCISPQTETAQNTTHSPTPTPTIAQHLDMMLGERDAAINRFIAAKYKGYKLVGWDNDDGCQDGVICIVQLNNGSQDKVVSIVAREFHKPDGSVYWFVYEATRLEVTTGKVNALTEEARESGVETGREETLANLTVDECQDALADKYVSDDRTYP